MSRKYREKTVKNEALVWWKKAKSYNSYDPIYDRFCILPPFRRLKSPVNLNLFKNCTVGE